MWDKPLLEAGKHFMAKLAYTGHQILRLALMNLAFLWWTRTEFKVLSSITCKWTFSHKLVYEKLLLMYQIETKRVLTGACRKIRSHFLDITITVINSAARSSLWYEYNGRLSNHIICPGGHNISCDANDELSLLCCCDHWTQCHLSDETSYKRNTAYCYQ